MKREGVAIYCTKNPDELNDFYGANTVFRKICCAVVEDIVKKGQWFGFGRLVDSQQVDVLNVENNKKVKLGTMVQGYFESSAYRTAIYKYLLHDYMCYYEQPIVKRTHDMQNAGNSYNKYIVTSNIDVVAAWLGISSSEAEKQYGAKLAGCEDDNGDQYYPYLKLYSTKTGERKITKPRSGLDLEASGIRIVPVFALKEGVDTLYEMASVGTYNVHFLKDSGQRRTINVCFNEAIVKEIYGGNKVVSESWHQVYNGDFETNPSFERGYIRVFENGSSIYNYPMRSINFARITSLEKAEPDVSYMYIDMDSVLESFIQGIYSYKWTNESLEEFISTLDAFDVGSSRVVNNVRMSTVTQVEMWAQSQNVQLSTVFIRQLALFMLSNPQWFEGYDGSPAKKRTELPMEASIPPTRDDIPVEDTVLPEQDNSKSMTDSMLGISLEPIDDDMDLPFM